MDNEFWDGSAKKFMFLMTPEQYAESTDDDRTKAAASVVRMITREVDRFLNTFNENGLLPDGKHRFFDDVNIIMSTKNGDIVARHKSIGLEVTVKVLV